MKKTEIKRRPLSDSVLMSLEAEEKEYREKDSENLYFRVKPNGNKSWQLRFKRTNGKWTWHGLGAYPEVSGKLARQKANELKKLISEGVDLNEYKEEKKQAELGISKNDFKSLAQEYCDAKVWVDGTRTRNNGALENHVYPIMGNRDFRKITKKEWLELFQSIQQKLHPRTGKPIVEMGNRVMGLCKEIYQLAEVTGRIDHNPISGIHKFLNKHSKQNMLHVSEEELPNLIKAIKVYPSKPISIGLQLSIMLGCRPTELRKAEWNEFNLNEALWVIPAHRMKKRIEHIIPLPKQALNLLNELKPLSEGSSYLFKGRDGLNKTISNNTFNKALKAMGYGGKQTPHGFRHILSTSLREKGFAREYVESALAHKVGGVEGIYNKAVYIKQRTKMMQTWADYLDDLANDKQSVLTYNLDVYSDLTKELGGVEQNSQLLKEYIASMLADAEDQIIGKAS